ncbi:uncharacterized protein [Henckelia pumila]|uniref:uncharacterized protein n=1 Tax=Henckelia pumila TaxID=405737 RepID=UPI003C6DFA22
MGGKNPEEARNWMARIESDFQALECTEEQKMEVLEFVLDGCARLWWDAKAALERTERRRVTWEDFRQQCQKSYFPPFFRQARSMELLMLRHGSMTIDKYQRRFIDLLPYSPHINKIDAYRQVENSNRRAQLMMTGQPGGLFGPGAQSVVQSGSTSSFTTTSSGSRGSRASCRKASGACFICGEQGHLRRDCPTHMGTASGSGSQAGS